MTSSLTSSQTVDSNQPSAATPTFKAITFQIGNLNLALRIEAVYKILKQPPIYSSGLNSAGIAHMGDREVMVLDLQRQLFHTSTIEAVTQRGYLIVVTSPVNGLYGIPVETVPTLMDIPLTTLRVLPEAYRRADTLGIASHVAVIPQDEGSLTVFLVDVSQLNTQ